MFLAPNPQVLGEAPGFGPTSVSAGLELNYSEHVSVLNLRTYVLAVLTGRDIPEALAEKVLAQDIFSVRPSRVQDLPRTLSALQAAVKPTAFIVASLSELKTLDELRALYLKRFGEATSMEQLKEQQRNSKAATSDAAHHEGDLASRQHKERKKILQGA